MIRTQYLSRVSQRREKVESFDRYPFSLAAVRKLDQLEFHPNMTFFIGENGPGKSTLLEALAVSLGFNAEGGTRNFCFGTCASHSPILMAYSDAWITSADQKESGRWRTKTLNTIE